MSKVLFTNPSARAGYDTRLIFKRSLTGLNSDFSFSSTSCLTKAEEPSLSYYLPIAGGRIIGFIPSPRVLVLCEMQSVSSRIWTRVAVSFSYDDNDYTTVIYAKWLENHVHCSFMFKVLSSVSWVLIFFCDFFAHIQEVIEMKRSSFCTRSPKLEFYHQMQFISISRTHFLSYSFTLSYTILTIST